MIFKQQVSLFCPVIEGYLAVVRLEATTKLLNKPERSKRLFQEFGARCIVKFDTRLAKHSAIAHKKNLDAPTMLCSLSDAPTDLVVNGTILCAQGNKEKAVENKAGSELTKEVEEDESAMLKAEIRVVGGDDAVEGHSDSEADSKKSSFSEIHGPGEADDAMDLTESLDDEAGIIFLI